MPGEQEERNKAIVRDCYELMFDQRKPREAAEMYVGTPYLNHNPAGVEGGGAAEYATALEGLFEKLPDFRVEIKRIIAEGDLVAMHCHNIPSPGDLGSSVIHFFRLENGKIVEHWDASQAVPEKSANSYTMF